MISSFFTRSQSISRGGVKVTFRGHGPELRVRLPTAQPDNRKTEVRGMSFIYGVLGTLAVLALVFLSAFAGNKLRGKVDRR